MAYSEFLKGMAIGMMRVWKCARKVGREINVPHPTVSRWWTRWCAGEGPGRRAGSGRPRKTTPRTDRKLVIACKRNRFETVPKLTVAWNFGSGAACSVRTAYRRLAEVGIRSYRPAVRIPLSPTHKAVRKNWCPDHLTWTQEQWRSVLWSDESRFSLDFHDGRIHVHRLSGERFSPCCITEHNRHGGGSVMVWAAIWHGGRCALIVVDGTLTGQRYRDEILLPCVIPTVRSRNLLFQHDNAPPHRARVAAQALAQNDVPLLRWPAHSPDLSPIEHAWDVLGRRLHELYPMPPVSLHVLRQRLIEQWNRIPQHQLDVLCDSLPQRLTACLRANGAHTRF